MPVGYSSTVKTAIAQPVFNPRVLLEIEGVLNWWDDRKDVVWDSKTWKGSVPLSAISDQQSETSSGSRNVQIEIGAADPAVRALASEDNFLLRVRIWRAFLDSSGAIIADPKLVYDERIDYMVLQRAARPRLLVNCENISILMAQSAPRLRTHQDHVAEYSGDNFYRRTARLVDNPIHVLVGYRPPLSL